jgi:hypothetical protein
VSGDARTGRSDLGDVESRIRRILNLEGLVPTDWDGKILPVMIVGDGTLPGYGGSRLRRWQLSNFLTGAAGVDRWVTCDSDVIIDRIACIPGANTVVSVFYQGPNDATPGAIAGRNAPMIDRAQTAAELAPIRDAQLGLAGGSTLFNMPGAGTINVGAIYEIIRTPFLLAGPNVPGADGARLRFTSGGNCSWTIEGRTF